MLKRRSQIAQARGLWRGLRALTPQRRSAPLTLQHVGFSDSELPALEALMAPLSQQLALTLKVQGHGGDVVLMDLDCAESTPLQLLRAFNEERPMVVVPGRGSARASAAALLEHRQREVLRQLRALDVVRERSPHWQAATGWSTAGADADAAEGAPSAFDSGFDSELHADQLNEADLDDARRDVLRSVLHGLHDPAAATLTVGYGAGAQMRFDFQARRVHCDALAQQHLRAGLELPLPAAAVQLQPRYVVRELDQMVWDLGVAAGRFEMLDAPADWWHVPLQACDALSRLSRYTRQPRYLELGRCLGLAPETPSRLRHRARVGVTELRSFVQAALMLGLLCWVDSKKPQEEP